MLHQSGDLAAEYLFWRTGDKYDEPNMSKYKIISVDYVRRNKPSDNKNKMDLIIKVLDRILAKFGLENEL